MTTSHPIYRTHQSSRLLSIGSLLATLVLLGLTTPSSKTFEKYKEQLPGTEVSLMMLAIKGGTFTMGSPDSESGRRPDEGPQHQVAVGQFWMSEHEITWDLYRLFMERTIDDKQRPAGTEVSLKVDGVSGATTPYTDMSFGMGTDGFPAVSMTQYAASKFCEWLSAMTGHFYRLPTEAEWEYACRAGSTTAYHCNHQDLDAFAWHKGNSGGAYRQIGSKKPNAWGLYDMHGNVAEWTLDKYQPDYAQFEGKVTTNPYVPPDKTYPRVVRGGSWRDDPTRLRSAARMASTARWKAGDPQIPKSKWWHTDASFVGFRVVRPFRTPTPQQQRIYWGYQF